MLKINQLFPIWLEAKDYIYTDLKTSYSHCLPFLTSYSILLWLLLQLYWCFSASVFDSLELYCLYHKHSILHKHYEKADISGDISLNIYWVCPEYGLFYLIWQSFYWRDVTHIYLAQIGSPQQIKLQIPPKPTLVNQWVSLELLTGV